MLSSLIGELDGLETHNRQNKHHPISHVHHPRRRGSMTGALFGCPKVGSHSRQILPRQQVLFAVTAGALFPLRTWLGVKPETNGKFVRQLLSYHACSVATNTHKSAV